jgi:hypothetical protein
MKNDADEMVPASVGSGKHNGSHVKENRYGLPVGKFFRTLRSQRPSNPLRRDSPGYISMMEYPIVVGMFQLGESGDSPE